MWKEKVEISKFRKTSKELPWVNRNPRLFVILTSALALSLLFSKPIFDLLFDERIHNPALSRSLKARKGDEKE